MHRIPPRDVVRLGLTTLLVLQLEHPHGPETYDTRPVIEHRTVVQSTMTQFAPARYLTGLAGPSQGQAAHRSD